MTTGRGGAKSGPCLPDIYRWGLPAGAGSLGAPGTPSQTSSASWWAPEALRGKRDQFTDVAEMISTGLWVLPQTFKDSMMKLQRANSIQLK